MKRFGKKRGRVISVVEQILCFSTSERVRFLLYFKPISSIPF